MTFISKFSKVLTQTHYLEFFGSETIKTRSTYIIASNFYGYHITCILGTIIETIGVHILYILVNQYTVVNLRTIRNQE